MRTAAPGVAGHATAVASIAADRSRGSRRPGPGRNGAAWAFATLLVLGLHGHVAASEAASGHTGGHATSDDLDAPHHGTPLLSGGFTPDPELPPPGQVRITLLSNTFQVDPPRDSAYMRHPGLLRVETSPIDGFAIEMALGSRASFGLKYRLYHDAARGFSIAAGVDEILSSGEAHLFGEHAESEEEQALRNRFWGAVLREGSWYGAKLGLAVLPEEDATQYVPFWSAEARLPLHLGLGWESWVHHGTWRQSIFAGLDWDPVSFVFGFSELQSWLIRGGQLGWHGSPPTHAETGIDNPGIWTRITVRFGDRPAPDGRAARAAQMARDSAIADRVRQAGLHDAIRQGLAELAVRLDARRSTTYRADPVEIAVVRRRLVAAGAPAREILWRCAVDAAMPREERIQALSTLGAPARPDERSRWGGIASSDDSSFRAEAALALVQIPGPEADGLLARLAGDPSPFVRACARRTSAEPPAPGAVLPAVLPATAPAGSLAPAPEPSSSAPRHESTRDDVVGQGEPGEAMSGAGDVADHDVDGAAEAPEKAPAALRRAHAGEGAH